MAGTDSGHGRGYFEPGTSAEPREVSDDPGTPLGFGRGDGARCAPHAGAAEVRRLAVTSGHAFGRPIHIDDEGAIREA